MKVHQLINALSHLPSDAEVDGNVVRTVDGILYSLEALVDEILDAQDDGRHVQIANATTRPPVAPPAAPPATPPVAPPATSSSSSSSSPS